MYTMYTFNTVMYVSVVRTTAIWVMFTNFLMVVHIHFSVDIMLVYYLITTNRQLSRPTQVLSSTVPQR